MCGCGGPHISPPPPAAGYMYLSDATPTPCSCSSSSSSSCYCYFFCNGGGGDDGRWTGDDACFTLYLCVSILFPLLFFKHHHDSCDVIIPIFVIVSVCVIVSNLITATATVPLRCWGIVLFVVSDSSSCCSFLLLVVWLDYYYSTACFVLLRLWCS